MGVDDAVSFEAAAQRYAPFLSAVSQVRCRLLAGSGGDAAIADLGRTRRPQRGRESRRHRSEVGRGPPLSARSAARAESGWPVRSRCTSTSSAARVEPRRWPNTCAERGSASDGQARNVRRLQRPVHARLRARCWRRCCAAWGRGRTRSILAGGLTPRYLVPARPPVVPAHAGTMDVDIVAGRSAAARRHRGVPHARGQPQAHGLPQRADNEQVRNEALGWRSRIPHAARRADGAGTPRRRAPDRRAACRPLPTEGTISALNIPHSSIVLRPVPRLPRSGAKSCSAGTVWRCRAREARRHRQLHLPEGLRVSTSASNERTPTTRVYCTHCIAPVGLDAVVAAFSPSARWQACGRHSRGAGTSCADACADDEATEGYRKRSAGFGGRVRTGRRARTPELREARVLRRASGQRISSIDSWLGIRVAANHASSSSDLLDSRKRRSRYERDRAGSAFRLVDGPAGSRADS
jgi:hypothetical protein